MNANRNRFVTQKSHIVSTRGEGSSQGWARGAAFSCGETRTHTGIADRSGELLDLGGRRRRDVGTRHTDKVGVQFAVANRRIARNCLSGLVLNILTCEIRISFLVFARIYSSPTSNVLVDAPCCCFFVAFQDNPSGRIPRGHILLIPSGSACRHLSKTPHSTVPQHHVSPCHARVQEAADELPPLRARDPVGPQRRRDRGRDRRADCGVRGGAQAGRGRVVSATCRQSNHGHCVIVSFASLRPLCRSRCTRPRWQRRVLHRRWHLWDAWLYRCEVPHICFQHLADRVLSLSSHPPGRCKNTTQKPTNPGPPPHTHTHTSRARIPRPPLIACSSDQASFETILAPWAAADGVAATKAAECTFPAYCCGSGTTPEAKAVRAASSTAKKVSVRLGGVR